MVFDQKIISYEQRFGSQPEVIAVINAAKLANRVSSDLFRGFQSGKTDLQVSHKESDTNVKGFEDVYTVADIENDKAIKAILKEALDIPILSEETVKNYFDNANAGDRRWLIDPIDGTHCFRNGNPDFSVTIALQEKQPDGSWKTCIGCVSIPMHDEIYIADEHSAHLIQGSREKRLSRAVDSEISAFSGSLKDSFREKRIDLVIYKDGKSDEAGRWMTTRDNMFESMGDAGVRTFSSAFFIAKMADGWFDGSILAADANKFAWDTDAAKHIASKAGIHIKEYTLDGEKVVLLANSQSLLTALEHQLKAEYEKTKPREKGAA